MRWRDRARIWAGAIRQRTIPGVLAFVLTRGCVAAGPFAGMRYIVSSTGSALAPKLLGTYEAELHDVVKDMLRRNSDLLVDVGAAEGYYAVGFARRASGMTVIAFEQEATGRRLLAKLAAANDVSGRVAIHGRCEPKDLQRVLKRDALLITDVEGYERVLIDPAAVPALRQVTILTEVHAAGPELGDELCARLRDSHEPAWIRPIARPISTSSRYAAGRGFERYLQCPSPFYWLYFKPKTSDTATLAK